MEHSEIINSDVVLTKFDGKSIRIERDACAGYQCCAVFYMLMQRPTVADSSFGKNSWVVYENMMLRNEFVQVASDAKRLCKKCNALRSR